MTVLSDREITRLRESGEMVIHPFDERSLGSSSYDVALGEWYYLASSRGLGPGWYNIYSRADVASVWGPPRAAATARELRSSLDLHDWSGIGEDDRIIVLPPRGNLLCHTREFIGARDEHTTMMKARSSIGRSLLNVCHCAGMGDVGYVHRWTMEIHNRSDYVIPLVVGRRVAQIVFMRTGPTDRRYRGKYQEVADLDELVRSWTPDMMLPRLNVDRELAPAPAEWSVP